MKVEFDITTYYPTWNLISGSEQPFYKEEIRGFWNYGDFHHFDAPTLTKHVESVYEPILEREKWLS